MPVYYRARILRRIHDRIDVIVKSDTPQDLTVIEKEAEKRAKTHSEINLSDPNHHVTVSLTQIDLIEDDQLQFDFK